MLNLLLVEDDEQIIEALTLSLERLGYRLIARPAMPVDLEVLLAEVDAVVLDIGLPGDDGFAVCRRIRQTSSVPIVMLTARSDDIDAVAGLEAGADDYVVKPVSPRVLDARIKAVRRRLAPDAAAVDLSPRTLQREGAQMVGDLIVDRAAAEVLCGGTPLQLSPIETRLVYAFVDHPGQVLSREQLLTRAWDHEFLGDSRLVDNAVQRLRAKLEATSARVQIETVRGFGYRFRPV